MCASVVKQNEALVEKFIMIYQTAGKINIGDIRKGWSHKVLVCSTESVLSSLGTLPVSKID